MSERDDDMTGGEVGCALVIAVFLLVLMIVIIDKKNVSEIRDLQRRVSQLESERR